MGDWIPYVSRKEIPRLNGREKSALDKVFLLWNGFRSRWLRTYGKGGRILKLAEDALDAACSAVVSAANNRALGVRPGLEDMPAEYAREAALYLGKLQAYLKNGILRKEASALGLIGVSREHPLHLAAQGVAVLINLPSVKKYLG